MKKNQKECYNIKTFSVILSIIGFLTTPFFLQISTNYNNALDNSRSVNINIPYIAYFNNSMTTIDIDGNGANNWTWAKDQDWCTLIANVYYIENLTINATSSTFGIRIRDSNVDFEIRNCTIIAATSQGIDLQNVSLGLITQNNITCYNDGIKISSDSSNITISQNTLYNTGNSILVQGPNITIIENNFTLYFSNGINLEGQASNCLIEDNLFSLSPLIANISLYSGAAIMLNSILNSTVKNNTMDDRGIIITGNQQQRASHNIDITNKVNDKTLYYLANQTGISSGAISGAGQIILVNCNYTTISGFDLSNCSLGISLSYSENCTIENNNFSRNQKGMEIVECHNITINSSIFTKNYDSGIYVYNSEFANITGNRLFNNSLYAIQGTTPGWVFGDNNYIADNIIFGSKTGIYLDSCNEWVMKNNTIDEGTDSGISIYNTRLCEIEDNILTNIGNAGYDGTGIKINYFSETSTITGNNISYCTYGMQVKSNSKYNDILNNKIDNNNKSGIFVDAGSHENEIDSNNISFNGEYGIYNEDSSENNITHNEINQNNITGIYIYDSIECIISNNTIQNSTICGILIHDSSQIIIFNNTIKSSNNTGIYLDNADSNVITYNTLSGNIIYCIYVTSTSTGNIILYNSCSPIYQEGGGSTGDPVIPGFNIILFISIISMVSIVSIIKKRKHYQK